MYGLVNPSELPEKYTIVRKSSSDYQVYRDNKPTGIKAETRADAVSAAWVESALRARGHAGSTGMVRAPDTTFSPGAVDRMGRMAQQRPAMTAPVAAPPPQADKRNNWVEDQLRARAVKRPLAAGKKPVTFLQARSLGASMGGMNNYIHASFTDSMQKNYDKLSHQDILTHLGVDSDLASRILDAMERAGVRESTYPSKRPQDWFTARAIFEEMTGRLTPMMRPNPFFVTPEGTAHEVDEETFAKYQKARGHSIAAGTGAPRARDQQDRDAVTYAQAKTIGLSVGGFGEYYPPGIHGDIQGRIYGEGKTSHADALRALGLTRERASRVIDAMVKADVAVFYPPPQTDRNKITHARAILAQVGEVTQPMLLPNPFYVTPKGTAHHVDEETFSAHRRQGTIPRTIEREGLIESHDECPPGYEIVPRNGTFHVFYQGQDTGKYGFDHRKACEIASRMVDGRVQKRAPRAGDVARKNCW